MLTTPLKKYLADKDQQGPFEHLQPDFLEKRNPSSEGRQAATEGQNYPKYTLLSPYLISLHNPQTLQNV